MSKDDESNMHDLIDEQRAYIQAIISLMVDMYNKVEDQNYAAESSEAGVGLMQRLIELQTLVAKRERECLLNPETLN